MCDRNSVDLFLFYQFSFGSSIHHINTEPWQMHFHHGIFEFFGGSFSVLLLISGVLIFYYFMRGGTLGRMFPIFPKRPIIPVTIPFARAPNYIDTDRPEAILLTTTKSTPAVFYSNVGCNQTPGTGYPSYPDSATSKFANSGYNIL